MAEVTRGVELALDPSFEARSRAIREWWSYDGTVARTGTTSLAATRNNTGTTSSLPAQTVPVVAGEQVRVAAWRLTTADYNGTGDNGKIRVGDQNGALLGAVEWGNGQTWAERATVYTIPAGVTALTISLVANHTAGTVWVDDLSVVALSRSEATHADAAPVVDAAATTQEQARSGADAAPVVDAVGSVWARDRTVADAARIADSTTASRTRTRAQADAALAADTVAVQRARGGTTDAALAADGVQVARGWTREAVDAAGVSDAVEVLFTPGPLRVSLSGLRAAGVQTGEVRTSAPDVGRLRGGVTLGRLR